MENIFFEDGNETLAQFIDFCKNTRQDTTLLKDLQYKDAFRQIGLAALATSEISGVPVTVLLAKAWEIFLMDTYGSKTSFESFVRKTQQFFSSEDRESLIETGKMILIRHVAQCTSVT